MKYQMEERNMYEKFAKNYKVEKEVEFQNHELIENLDINTKNLFVECGGFSFNNGLYRIHNSNSSLHWALIVTNYYPKYKGKIIPFAFDWMGRQFAIHVNNEDYILMFDPATGEDFELKENLLLFHNETLVNDSESILAEQLFNKVAKTLSITKIGFNECVGYKTSLFLGGLDNLDNYEMTDMEVYWEVQCQLYLQLKDLPPGTKIDSINFKK